MIREKIERQPLSLQVAERLRSQISQGIYPIGSRLPTEPQLVTELGVGRSSIREAVQALVQAGILDVRQGSGTYVRALPHEAESLPSRLRRARLAEVHEARRLLEGDIARLAALRRTEADLPILRAALDAREALRLRGVAENLVEFAEVDLRFHQAVAHASRNTVLEDMYASFATVFLDSLIARQQEVGKETDIERQLYQARLHEQLYEAIVARDPEKAQDAVESLLGDILQSMAS